MARVLITKWFEDPWITPDIFESHVFGLGRQDERLDRDRGEVGDDLGQLQPHLGGIRQINDDEAGHPRQRRDGLRITAQRGFSKSNITGR